MKRVLVTGASGFIGRYTLPFLRHLGYEVYPVSSKPLISSEVTWIQANLLNSHEIYALMQQVRPSHLLHFAWETTPGKFWSSPKNLEWVTASLDLFQAFSKTGGKRAVVAGTCAEYDWNTNSPLHETSSCHPNTFYGACKAGLHQILDLFSKQNEISLAWGRIFHLYGPSEHPDRFIPTLIRKLRLKEPVPCTHGNQIRDFMHTHDVASAFVALLESDLQGPVNIASGEPASLREIGTKIAEQLGSEDLLQWGSLPMPPHEPLQLIASTRCLYQELCWKRTYDLDTGLKELLWTYTQTT